MRLSLPAVAFILVLLSACGYVGPVLPPSPKIPATIGDLSVIERGDKILVNFDTPPRTTDNMGIKRFSEIDLRIGPAITPFDFDRWADTARQYPISPPPPNDPDDPQLMPLSDSIPVSDWQGQRIAIAVRTAVRRNGHYSSWSNRVVLNVVPPLVPPVVTAAPTATGIALAWQEQSPVQGFRILRQDPGAKAPVEIGTSQKTSYLDTTAQFDTPYQYSVIAADGNAESLPSDPYPFTAKDTFPPSVPTGITALSGPDSIEISWQRSPESDTKGYYIYRSANDAPFERLGVVSVANFSDHAVEHGKTYRYGVSAVDKNNNESDKSPPVSVTF